MLEFDGTELGLLAQPPHAHSEVAVAGGDNRILNHADARLVILEDRNRCRMQVHNLSEHAANPESSFAGFNSSNELCFGSAQADHLGDLSFPQDGVAVDHPVSYTHLTLPTNREV